MARGCRAAALPREASRAQGAALLRTAAPAWPAPALAALRALPRRAPPARARRGGRGAPVPAPAEAAALAVHHLVGGACTAAVRLLGLDPLRVAARGRRPSAAPPTRWSPTAAALPRPPSPPTTPALLPTDGSPLPDVLAELHHRSEATLFAS